MKHCVKLVIIGQSLGIISLFRGHIIADHRHRVLPLLTSVISAGTFEAYLVIVSTLTAILQGIVYLLRIHDLIP